MSDTKRIEARLEQSLQNQVKLSRLDRSFDAAVWARIEAEEAKGVVAAAEAVPSRAVRASRWLAISNSIGIAVTLGVALYFAYGAFADMQQPVNIGFDFRMPVIADDTLQRVIAVLGQLLGVAAVLFGLSFTSIGRRLRTSFS
ncbi:MAG TPA: hypothetical protein VM146_00035 [Steroidobacteraceae bacterium]|nr:hypothetical protein [Steroidobacteraceae bacterium]